MPRPYEITLGQKMYGYAMPRQYTMLKEAPYVIIPVFWSKGLNGEYVSKLNPFATIWCVIENIFLAAASEGLSCSMRIPLNQEHDTVKEKTESSADLYDTRIYQRRILRPGRTAIRAISP